MRRKRASIAPLLLVAGLLGPSAAWAAERSVSELGGDIQTLEGQIAHYLTVIQPPSNELTSREIGRRLVDGMVLHRMKEYSKASTLLMDVVSRWPGTPAASEAAFFLADSLLQQREFMVARTYFERVVNEGSGNSYYQLALQRLLELEMRRAAVLGRAKTADQERLAQVESLLRKIEAIPQNQREPSVDYVRGKYLFFMDKFDEAFRVFASLGPKHPYYFHAVYFLGACHIQQNRLNAAAAVYDQLIERILESTVPIPSETKRQVLQLIILAGARVAYVKGTPKDIEHAIELYNAVPRKSAHYDDSLYERAWAYLKAARYDKAVQALELLAIVNPNYPKADEARVLIGNLKIRTQDFSGAKEVFRTAANSLRPVYRKLHGLRGSGIDPKNIFEQLVAPDPKQFEIEIRLPALALKWLRQQPEVKQALLMLGDLTGVQKMILECEGLIRTIQRALKGGALISRFPTLAVTRARAADFDNQLMKIQVDLSEHLAALVDPVASPAERQALARIRKARAGLSRKLQQLPSSTDAYQIRIRKMRDAYDRVDSNALVVEMEAQNLEAMLRAVESYYRLTEQSQSIPKNVMEQNLRALREQIALIQARVKRVREDVADSRLNVGMDDSVMRTEKGLRSHLAVLLDQERRLMASLGARLSPRQRAQMERITALIGRGEKAEENLGRVNTRIDAILDAKRDEIVNILTEEQAKLVGYRKQLALYKPSSAEVVGGVTLQSFQRVSQMVHDVLVKADAGVLDVVWAFKNLTKGYYEKRESQYMRAMEALKAKYREARSEP